MPTSAPSETATMPCGLTRQDQIFIEIDPIAGGSNMLTSRAARHSLAGRGKLRTNPLFTMSKIAACCRPCMTARIACAADATSARARAIDRRARSSNECWWSQTGSNRRPHACKARALPTELWPRSCRSVAPIRTMVGPGRLERPTSRLSGVRSNHLSYGPGSADASAHAERASSLSDADA